MITGVSPGFPPVPSSNLLTELKGLIQDLSTSHQRADYHQNLCWSTWPCSCKIQENIIPMVNGDSELLCRKRWPFLWRDVVHIRLWALAGSPPSPKTLGAVPVQCINGTTMVCWLVHTVADPLSPLTCPGASGVSAPALALPPFRLFTTSPF